MHVVSGFQETSLRSGFSTFEGVWIYIMAEEASESYVDDFHESIVNDDETEGKTSKNELKDEVDNTDTASASSNKKVAFEQHLDLDLSAATMNLMNEIEKDVVVEAEEVKESASSPSVNPTPSSTEETKGDQTQINHIENVVKSTATDEVAEEVHSSVNANNADNTIAVVAAVAASSASASATTKTVAEDTTMDNTDNNSTNSLPLGIKSNVPTFHGFGGKVLSSIAAPLSHGTFVDFGLDAIINNTLMNHSRSTANHVDDLLSLPVYSYAKQSSRMPMSNITISRQPKAAAQVNNTYYTAADETKLGIDVEHEGKDCTTEKIQENESPPYWHGVSPDNIQGSVSPMQTTMGTKKGMAGYVSEPWKKSPTKDTESYLDELSFGMKQVPVIQQEQDGSTEIKTTFRTAISSVNENMHAAEVKVISPTAHTLLQSKAVSPDMKASLRKTNFETTATIRATKTKKKLRKKQNNTMPPYLTRSFPNDNHAKELDELLLKETLDLAAEQAQLQKELERHVRDELKAARAVVFTKLNDDERIEKEREEKVIEFAEKTLEAKLRIKALQADKGASIADREENKELIRQQMLKDQAMARAEIAAKKTEEALLRREKYQNDAKLKKDTMEKQMLEKMRKTTEILKSKKSQKSESLAEKAIQQEEKMKEKIAYAEASERETTSRRLYDLERKDDEYNTRAVIRKSLQDEEMATTHTKQLLLSFRAEQRRRMMDEKKRVEREIGRIRQAKEAVIAVKRAKTNAERPIKLNRIYADQLKKQSHAMGQLSTESVDTVTPGPGEYFKDIKMKIKAKGGYMASSRVPETISEVPGPGHYETDPANIDGVEANIAGTIKFISRGKTDVDWTILNASKLPGIGQYNPVLPANSQRSVKLIGKGKSQLDEIITRASKIPGPQDYNLQGLENVKTKAGSLEAYLLGECEKITTT
jgi:hypothetical protein